MKCKTLVFLIFFLCLLPVTASAQNLEEISYFETYLYDNSPNRVHNIKLAISKINGFILNPGETFSFNKVVGKRTSSAGYKDAKIFSGGKIVEGLGGGICQLSTTIFQAAEQIALEILEAHRHSLNVRYITRGKDAAVSYGVQDLRFVNSLEHPLKITCEVSERKVKVSLAKIAVYIPIKVKSPTMEATTEAIFTNNFLLVPVRDLNSFLGYHLDFNYQTKTLTLTKENSQLTFIINNKMFEHNGQKITLPVAPIYSSGRCYLPARLLAYLDLNPVWDEVNSTLLIN